MCIAKNLFLKSEKFNTEIGMTGGNLGLERNQTSSTN